MASNFMDLLLSPSQPQGPVATAVPLQDNEPLSPIVPFDSIDTTELTNVPLLPSEVTFPTMIESRFEDSFAREQSFIEPRNESESGSSQPICNQQYFTLLDDILTNLPKAIYITKLVQLCKRNDDDICLYRSILYKRAQEIENCPVGSLMQRRSTENERSYTKYAKDCYCLQSFLNNEDAKILADIFAKNRSSSKCKLLKDDNTEMNIVRNELATALTKISTLTEQLDKINQTRLSEQEHLEKMRADLADMKTYCADMVCATTKNLSYHMHLIQTLKLEIDTLKKNQSYLLCQKTTNNKENTNSNNMPSEPIVINQSSQSPVSPENPKASNETAISDDCYITSPPPQTLSYAHVVKNATKPASEKISVRITERSEKYTQLNQNTTQSNSMPTQCNPNYIDDKQNEEPIFRSVSSTKTRRYYVGGISKKSNRSGMLRFLKENNIHPQSLRLIDTGRGSLAAKVTVHQEEWESIENRRIWPRKMYCRRWYSEMEWESRLYTTLEREQNNLTEDVD